MRAALLAAGLGLVLAASPGRAEAGPEPQGYRMEDYRAPTPATLAGAEVLDTPAAERLWRAGTAVFVDVLPRPVKPPNLPAGTIWRDKPHASIPGAVWLVNAGYGALSPEMQLYFERSLTELTAGRRDRPLVFFCLTDCWMSWNAAKRALELGYGRVLWYPAGADGWEAAGLPVERLEPRP